MRILSALVFTFVCVIPVYADTNPDVVLTDNRLRSQIDLAVHTSAGKFMEDRKTVGLSLGILKAGKAYIYNYGEVENGSGRLPTGHTLYELASITKTFTGTLLAQAVVEGKVRLDDDVRLYLEGGYPNLEFDGQPVRLFHLVNHTSGFPFMLPDRPGLFQNPDPAQLPKILTEISNSYTRDNFYEDLHRVKLDKTPGTEFKYSNAAAQLMGYILERVYGMSYEQLVAAKIAKPLKLKETKISLSRTEQRRLAKGHYEDGSIALYMPSGIQAAGALRSSASDMLKYLGFHLNEKNAAVLLSHQPTWGDINYYAAGLNWQMKKTADGSRRIWQSGGSFGFSSLCLLLPERNIGLVLLANESDRNAEGRLNTLADELLNILDK